MEILKARTKFGPDSQYSNRIGFELLVDSIPTREDLKYESKRMSQGTFYFAEEGGYVSFYYHNPRDQSGYGGRSLTLNLKDGGEVTIKGPWSSSTPSILQAGFPQCMEVSITERESVWDKGHTFYAGAATLPLIQEACRIVNLKDEYNFQSNNWSLALLRTKDGWIHPIITKIHNLAGVVIDIENSAGGPHFNDLSAEQLSAVVS